MGNDVNAEFEVPEQAGTESPAEATVTINQAPAKPAKAKPAQRKAKPKVDETIVEEEDHEAKAVAEKLAAGWCYIFIDDVDEKGNSEVVGVNGKVYQIKRGERVLVPPDVVHVLGNAVETRITQSKDPVTGQTISKRQNRSAIPWRKV